MLLQECCGKFHSGAVPENALELMRSRYSAYAVGLVDYIIVTTHKKSSHRSPVISQWRKELEEFCNQTAFQGLKILEFIDGPQKASVAFSASLSQNGKDVSFTEKSSFLKDGGRWYYDKGQLL